MGVREAIAVRAAASSSARPSRPSRPRVLEPYLFLAPALAILFVFVILPAIWVVVLSVYRWDLISSDATPIA
ncbi:MAG TPA: hypothetical protein VKE27_11205, partial [Candidatus Dormibacteraeota bacterium]|nr:hypothetical protein [Candidatus Dormibacteraeota bacterium]